MLWQVRERQKLYCFDCVEGIGVAPFLHVPKKKKKLKVNPPQHSYTFHHLHLSPCETTKWKQKRQKALWIETSVTWWKKKWQSTTYNKVGWHFRFTLSSSRKSCPAWLQKCSFSFSKVCYKYELKLLSKMYGPTLPVYLPVLFVNRIDIAKPLIPIS